MALKIIGRRDDKIKRDLDAPDDAVEVLRGVTPVRPVRHHYKNVQIAVGTHLSSGRGPEENDLKRLDGLNDGVNELPKLFLIHLQVSFRWRH